MRRNAARVLVLTAALLAIVAAKSSLPAALAQGRPPAAPAAGAAPAPAAPQFAPLPGDTFAVERDSLMNVVLHQIAGRENAPAESVFKNIKMMKGVPAGRLLRIMNIGYGRSLGVRCAHCHVQDHWDSEEKPQKQIARDMADMSHTIDAELLPRIKNLHSEKPIVNCTTCHRNHTIPATSM